MNSLEIDFQQRIDRFALVYAALREAMKYAWDSREDGIDNPYHKAKALRSFYCELPAQHMGAFEFFYKYSHFSERTMLLTAHDVLDLDFTQFNEKHRVIKTLEYIG
ncbi:hypothetical protein [Tunicatimonas pelagia]|uniref:hypothetical protein n=1 Tax=Tunicatimonas pelagia TaxID=931531 RepID=UPI0026650384|nr:hypothetical protein [Tunicatimonas pelagia]WKN46503.1 hypothetical protein P0M28_30600 [Tunicatimonas pelagia]